MTIRTIVFLLLTTCLFAHDLYLMPAKFQVTPGEKIVVSVHNGDSFPDSDGTTDPRRLLDARLSDGTPIDTFQALGKATHGLTEIRKKGSIWASVHTIPKFIELEPAKFETYLKDEGLTNALDYRKQNGEADKPGRELYSKYAKALITSGAPDTAFSQVLGLTIEFVPQVNPASVKSGESIPIQVLFRGKPAADVQVIKSWSTQGKKSDPVVAGRTDKDGRISVPVETAGKWRFHTLVMERYEKQTEAQWESFWASMTFEVGNSQTTSQRLE
ncbi:MAG: DUF4198 domain-containing protein [Bryobacteraceae bacterium]|nr:DUF4198 domain-containing protein [Bryobacteraceae bacterium]